MPVNAQPARRRRALRPVVAMGAALVLLAAACGDDDTAAEDGRPLVVATHSLLGDLVANVVGDEAEVEVIMPVGADPHEFEPSAAQVALITEADLVVANGLGFEEGLLDAVETAEDAGVPVVELGEDLDPLPFGDEDHGDEGDEDHGDEGDEDHGHGSEDPHWFTDPARAADAVGLVAGAVGDLDGLDAGGVAERAADYAAEIMAVDAEIETLLADVADERRRLVTNHEVFGYFADRFDFEVVGTVIPSGTTLAEPSSAELAALVEVIEDAGVPAIFADTSSPTDLADVLAAETDTEVEVVELFSESLGEEGSGGATYLELVTTNAERIADALT